MSKVRNASIVEKVGYLPVCPYCGGDGRHDEYVDSDRPLFEEEEKAEKWLIDHLKECAKNPDNEMCKNCIYFDACLMAISSSASDLGHLRVCFECRPGQPVVICRFDAKPAICHSFKKMKQV